MVSQRLADVNNDGNLDVVVAGGSSGGTPQYGVFFGDGTGRLFFNPNTLIAGRSWYSLIVGDFDGDGKLDILDTAGSPFRLLRGNGNGTFTAGVTSQITDGLEVGVPVDIDGDGDWDLIALSGVSNYGGGFYTYVNDGTGRFTEGAAVPLPPRAFDLAVGDYNGDGHIDVLVGIWGLSIFGDDGNPSVYYLQGDGKGDSRPHRASTSAGWRPAPSLLNQPIRPSWRGHLTWPPSTIQFGAATTRAAENSGTEALTVTRSGDMGLAASVAYAVTGGTATAGADSQLAAGTLEFAPGEASKPIIVTLLDDQLIEGDETIQITLSNVTGAASSARNTTTLTITDDDGPAMVQFGASSYGAAENAGTATITVTRSGSTSQSASVHYATADATASRARTTRRLPAP